MGKLLARGTRKSLASQCLCQPNCRLHVLDGIGRIVASEIKALCSLGFNSVLRSADVNDLKTFSWEKVLSEVKNCAPTLLQLLGSCTRPRIGRSPNPNRKAIISLCICILCRCRCPSMILFQKIISLILYAETLSKTNRLSEFTRMRKLRLWCHLVTVTVHACLSHLGVHPPSKILLVHITHCQFSYSWQIGTRLWCFCPIMER